MGLLECASGESVWRGYDYFQKKKVAHIEKIGKDIYSAKVTGSSKNSYYAEFNVCHPRKSKCNCPHADGRRIICKHIVAAYFTAFPQEAENFYKEVMAYQDEEEKRREELADRVIEYVGKMKKADLRQALLDLLFYSPEWQYDRFVREQNLDADSD